MSSNAGIHPGHAVTGAPLLVLPPPLPTALFDSVVTYDTPGTTDIDLVARRLHVVDIAAIGNAVDANFPVGTEIGECLGITLISTGGPGETVNQGTGAVAEFSTLQNVRDCSLWTWSGTAWEMVSQWVQAATGGAFIQQFDNANLAGGALTITHNLGTSFPIVALYNNLGSLVGQDLRYTVVVIDANSFTLTISPVLLPIAGTWGISVL